MKTLFLVGILLVLFILYCCNNIDSFENIIFKNIKNVEINKINKDFIDYDELYRIFGNQDMVKIVVPKNYSINIIYKKDTTFEIVTLGEGTHTVNMNKGDMKISKMYINMNDKMIVIKDNNNKIIFAAMDPDIIDWVVVYSLYGYFDYHLVFPDGSSSIYYYSKYRGGYRHDHRHDTYFRHANTMAHYHDLRHESNNYTNKLYKSLPSGANPSSIYGNHKGYSLGGSSHGYKIAGGGSKGFISGRGGHR